MSLESESEVVSKIIDWFLKQDITDVDVIDRAVKEALNKRKIEIGEAWQEYEPNEEKKEAIDSYKESIRNRIRNILYDKVKDMNVVNDILKMSGHGKNTLFHKQLKDAGLTPASYLKQARKMAKKTGYDETMLEFSDNGKNKLMYNSPEGKKHFGRIGYNDYIIYLKLEKDGKVQKGTSKMKRNTFRKSHGEITKKHKLNKFSPNELAINILW